MTYQRKEVIGQHVLYLGNALEIMPMLEPVDLVCTDAPYLVSTGGFDQYKTLRENSGRSVSEFGGWMKEYKNQGDIVTCDIQWSDWIPLAFEVLKEGRHAYFMSNGKSIFDAHKASKDAGFDFHTLLVWDKRSALPNRWYQNITEFTLFLRKGKAFTINDPSSKNIFSMYQRDESAHPTEKPIELMSLYIGNSTKINQTVLDPFMGSGTTGAAAARLGRKFIGCEIDPKWFDVACERVSRALDQAHMFAEPLPMPPEVQPSMFDGDAA